MIAADTLEGFLGIGELGLDGWLAPVRGVLLAVLHAAEHEMGLIYPALQGGEAAWAGEINVVAAPHALALLNHLKGTQLLSPAVQSLAEPAPSGPDMADIRGQETSKRAVYIAAAGGYNLLTSRTPGSAKSLLAAALPGILPE